jgi:predicted RNA-binding Zn ribbon-like protein
MQTRSEKGAMDLNPEELCIRFVNTVAWRLRDLREERLPTADTLLRWLGENGLGGPRYLAHARAAWNVDEATDFHEAAIRLREAIYGIFHARIDNRSPPKEPLAFLNAWLIRPASGVELAREGSELIWRPSSLDTNPLELLRPIALSAANLMTGPRGHKVRQCSDDRGCGWLFVDESRAQNRRWCAMGDCGNRAKAARHRARKRKSHASP